ncbi:hypothetical protein DYD21_04895 [Rhodohalobacter sp. SW132]|nr:hypothetical protein DYD21_04895 [Rhodohalobacter sp. SW132]
MIGYHPYHSGWMIDKCKKHTKNIESKLYKSEIEYRVGYEFANGHRFGVTRNKEMNSESSFPHRSRYKWEFYQF